MNDTFMKEKLQSGTAITSDLAVKWIACSLFAKLCSSTWYLLQAADIFVSAGKWNHSGNASGDQLQLRSG